MYNKVVLLGRLTRDPELTTTASGVSVCKFTLAVDRKFKKDGEERQADFINCIAWRGTGEFVSEFFSKGEPILVDGSIQTRSWDDNEGKKHYATEVIVENCSFTGAKKQDAPQTQQSTVTTPPPSNVDDFIPVNEDDLPF